MSNEPSLGKAIFGLLMLYWSVCTIVWSVRNPIANPMTCFTRLHHVLAFDRLAEYQVVKTHENIGVGPWTVEKAAARQAELSGK